MHDDMGEANKIVLVVLPSFFPREEGQDLIKVNLQVRLKKKKCGFGSSLLRTHSKRIWKLRFPCTFTYLTA